ncbi:nitrate reductase cytochrome c-type subunit [Cellvibrio sp. NN19]|uniref:nitrate reductase cytochrome c-type subunit n=1 Tax=Cellvibrio chitinivorans TaxID=3102792 RepID=UPI002B402105|nr:nitrate reductase cytochrome c-type subunit [Cellvibrio sp. NN19]
MTKKILLAISLLCGLSALSITAIYVQAQQTQAQELSATEKTNLDAPAPDGIRPGGTLSQDLPAPKIPRERITSQPGNRNYPEQPPTIPHNIRGYQIDKNFNMCLSCHSRSASPQTGAPMVSITHFYDRDGQALAAVSPRRYFCVQCHLPQADVAPARPNSFKSIDTVLQAEHKE